MFGHSRRLLRVRHRARRARRADAHRNAGACTRARSTATAKQWQPRRPRRPRGKSRRARAAATTAPLRRAATTDERVLLLLPALSPRCRTLPHENRAKHRRVTHRIYSAAAPLPLLPLLPPWLGMSAISTPAMAFCHATQQSAHARTHARTLPLCRGLDECARPLPTAACRSAPSGDSSSSSSTKNCTSPDPLAACSCR